MARGPKRTICSRLDAGSTTEVAEGGAVLTRVTGNHVETIDSSDRGREGLITDKGILTQ